MIIKLDGDNLHQYIKIATHKEEGHYVFIPKHDNIKKHWDKIIEGGTYDVFMKKCFETYDNHLLNISNNFLNHYFYIIFEFPDDYPEEELFYFVMKFGGEYVQERN